MALSTQKTTEISQQYDPIRKRAQQQEAVALQTQKDSLTRNAARLGGGPSGAFVKQEQIAGNESAQRLQTANEGIDAQQMAAINQARDVQEGRDYATTERVASQAYGTGERVASQGFAAGESALARKLQRYGIDTGDKTQRYGIDKNARFQEAAITGKFKGAPTLAGQTLSDAQAQNKFENDANVKTNAINTFVTLKNSGYTPQQIGDLFKSLGLDRLGLNLGDIAGVTAATPPPAAAPEPAPKKQKIILVDDRRT